MSQRVEFTFADCTNRYHKGRTRTRSEHEWTTLLSSSITRSTHFSIGAFSCAICFFTIASNAMSGVNRPVLHKTSRNSQWLIKLRSDVPLEAKCQLFRRWFYLSSVLWHCWLGGRKGIWPVKNWVVGCWCGCLGWGADLHIAQQMPLPLTVSAAVNPDWF